MRALLIPALLLLCAAAARAEVPATGGFAPVIDFTPPGGEAAPPSRPEPAELITLPPEKPVVEPLEPPGAGNGPAEPTSPPGPDTSLYRLQYDDVVEISIWGEPDMTRQVKVGPDGRVAYPLAGDVLVVGRTFADVREDLGTRLKRYYKNPRVTIIGISYAGSTVIVMGKVAQPGKVEISRNSRVLDVLSKVGGLLALSTGTEELADLKNAYLSREGQFVEVDFHALLKGDMSQNVPVLAGDFIYIPPAYDNRVFVLGEVNRPGIVRFNNEMTILDALANTGGLTTTGMRSRICVLRGPKDKSPLVVQYGDLIRGKHAEVRLAAGDVVYVPETMLANLSRIGGQVSSILNAVLTGDDVNTRILRR